MFVVLIALPVSSAQDRVDLGDVREEHVMIPMRDGTKLSAYLYFPAGDGPWPVLYEQRYADLTGAGTRQANARLAKAGYVVCAENFRGALQSEGTWVGYRALGWGELQDGYDTVEWLAQQNWSTGKIGTFGSSQAGFAQNFLAVTRPPHLVAQYMIDTGLSLYHEGYRIGGTTRPERFRGMDAVCREPAHNRALLAEWFQHPTYDDYWKQEDCSRHFDKMDVPCFTIGSWFDFMNIGSIESFRGRQHRGGPNSRGKQQLLIGPWLHGGYLGKHTNKVGELTFPENAKFDAESHLIRWFDFWLKGRDNQVDRDPTVRYYVMGNERSRLAPRGEPNASPASNAESGSNERSAHHAERGGHVDGDVGNVWRETSDWPVPATPTSYFLREAGQLTQEAPAEVDASVSFLADPFKPNSLPGRAFPGAADARKFEEQAEVRTFTTEPLAEPVEWTGLVKAELFVTSTAKDTDFIVRISDVYPDGRSILLIDYIRRSRYRDGYEREVFLTPGKVAKVAFDVGWISQIFAKGHRIRVTVASTGAPFFEPNPNTGEPLGLEFPANALVAKNTVQVNRSHASRIIAPLRP
jgi:predicted acyl esterase